MVEQVGHEGGVVGQILAHPEHDGLAGEEAVPARGGHQEPPEAQGTQEPPQSHPLGPAKGHPPAPRGAQNAVTKTAPALAPGSSEPREFLCSASSAQSRGRRARNRLFSFSFLDPPWFELNVGISATFPHHGAHGARAALQGLPAFCPGSPGAQNTTEHAKNPGNP